MELRCAIVCSLVSFVISTPHGYGTKGGAAARAEAGAVASAFSGISGLPLSIPNGAVSGSFSKSSSSSFASSSASSSSGSFSFSGSGATGLSGFLGIPGNHGCKSEDCQSGSRINNPQESSAGNGLSSYSGAHAAAAAGAIAGVQNGANSPCSGNNCYSQKLPCEGKDCKDISAPINNNTPKKCTSAECHKTESGSSGDTSDVCAKGQCIPTPGSTSIDFNDSRKCKSGSCVTDTESKTPSKNYDANDIPGNTSGSPSLTSNTQPSDYDKTNNEAAKGSGVDCLHGNCGSSAQNLKPSNNYPSEHLYSGAPSSSTAPTVQSTISPDHKPLDKITGVSSSELDSMEPGNGALQNPKNHQTTCVGGHCNNEPIFKSPTNSSPQSTVTHAGCVSGKCDPREPNHHPDFDLSKTPTYTSVSDSSQKCVSGNCGSHSSELSYFSSSGSQTPSYSPESSPTGSTNCASGNCGVYPTGQNSGSHDDSKSITSTHPDSPLNKPDNCASGNCAGLPSSQPTNYDSSAPNIPNHKPSTCASGKCNSSPSIQFPNFDSSNLKNPTNPTLVSGSPNCASGNCPSVSGSGFSITEPKSPTYFPGTSPSGSPNCAFGKCGSFPASQHLQFDGFGLKIPAHVAAISGSSSNCASGNCASLPIGPGLSTMGPKLPSYSSGILSSGPLNCGNGNCGNRPSISGFTTNLPKTPGISFSTSSNCALGNCNSYPSSQYPGFTSGSSTPANPQTPDSSVSCAFGNCANVPSTKPNANIGTGTKFPNSSPSSSQYPNFDVSGPKSPTYFGGGPGDCALGNCGNVPQPGLFKPQIPNNIQGPQSSGSPNCASGSCENLPPSGPIDFSSAGHKIPSYSHKIPSDGLTNCASGNCGSYPHGQYPDFSKPAPPSNVLHEFAGSKFPTHSQEPSPSGATNCLSNDCNIPSLQPMDLLTSSKNPNQPNDSFPDFIPLAPTNPTHVVGSSGTTSTHIGEPINSVINPISNSGAASGAHSSSSIFATSMPGSKKEQIYTGGFGGPPGILNPYEFKSPPPGGYYSATNKPSSSSPCTSGNCASHTVSNPDNNRHEILGTINPMSCGSEKCDSHTNSPNYAQHGASNAAFAAAAATSDGNRVVYTGGFGGPPGILKPYDGGKVTGGTANIFVKDSINLQNRPNRYGVNGSPSQPTHKLNSSGAQAGAAALASAGTYSNGNHGGDNKGAGGCKGGCGSPGNGSFGGSFEWSSVLELPKTGILNDELEAARAIAKSTAGAISGAGANSFGFGGSFASSSAHATAGAATKGGYGR